MLIKPTIFQLSANTCNRVLGFFITAILYRIYSLEEIGEYFLIISLIGLFYSFQNMGTHKTLINFHVKKDKDQESKILKTRFLLSLISLPIFYFIAINMAENTASIIILLIGLTLILNSLSLDHIIVAKKKFLTLSLIQFLAQFFLFAFFTLAILVNFKPLIALHHIIPSLLLVTLIMANVLFNNNINIIKIITSSIVSISFFLKNRTLILCEISLPLIIAFDYFLANKILQNDELGLMAGLFRYSLLSYGFLTIINKLLFSYSINTANSDEFKYSRDSLISNYRIVSFVTMILLLYPYLKIVMALEDISILLYPGIIISISLIFMPTFFLEMNKIESNYKIVSFKTLILFITGLFFILYWSTIFLSNMFSGIDSLILLSLVFFVKWITLAFGLIYVRKKSSIK